MRSILETVAAVQTAPGSMYTREDVLALLTGIQIPEPSEQVANGLTKKQIEELCEKIVDAVRDNAENLGVDDVVELSSAEFSLYGNEIQLESVNIDSNSITRSLVDGIGDVIEAYFENLENEESSD